MATTSDGDHAPRYAQPMDRAPERTHGSCAFCRDQGTSWSCFWQIVAAVLDGTDVDDAEVPLVNPNDEACRHWRRSKWA